MIVLHENIHNSIKQIYVKSHLLILIMVEIAEVIIINISRQMKSNWILIRKVNGNT